MWDRTQRKHFRGVIQEKQKARGPTKSVWPWGTDFQPFVILFKTQPYSSAFIRKCIHSTIGAAPQRRYKEILVNRHTHCKTCHQALKQSDVASGAFGLYLLHEFMCHSGGNKKKSTLILFKATTTSETQVVDEEPLTDADLNISEDEAYTPGRGEGLEWREHVENIWMANRGRWQVQWKLTRNTSEEQRSRHRAAESTNYISKTNAVGGSFCFCTPLIHF